MDIQGLQYEFVYEGTAQVIGDIFWKLNLNRYDLFTKGKGSYADVWVPTITKSPRGGTPLLIEYEELQERPFFDESLGQERTYHERVPCVTFRLTPLPSGHTRIEAHCHYRAYEEWYYYLLELFGVQTEAMPKPSTDVLGPSEILRYISKEATPGTDDWWNALFTWYDQYKKQGFRLTQSELAKLCGYSPQYVKRKLGNWRAEFST